MRGTFRDQAQLFSYVSPGSRVPAGHPLRKIRGLVRYVLSPGISPKGPGKHPRLSEVISLLYSLHWYELPKKPANQGRNPCR